MNSNNKGFTVVVGIVIAAFLIVGGAVVYSFMQKNKTVFQSQSVPPAQQQTKEESSTVKIETATTVSSTVSSSPRVSAAVPSKPQTAVADTLVAGSVNINIPFSFRYPKEYCFGFDIGAVFVRPAGLCEGALKEPVEKIFAVRAFPDEKAKTTEEYLQTDYLLRSFQKTSQTRIIGGYKAVRMKDPQHPNNTIYAFLTKYNFSTKELDPDNTLNIPDNLPEMKYGVVIISNLSQVTGGKEAEELMLSTFRFED